MKNTTSIHKLCFLFFAMLTIISACKKEDETGTPKTDTFPTPLNSFISQSMIDSLRAAGAAVYSGTTPPTVNGIYFMHPDSCTYDNSPAHSAGSIYSDYKFKFSSQNNTAFTVDVAQKSIPAGVLSSSPVYSFISGSGNNFSIFIIRTLTPSGVTVQQYNVLSGTLTSGGIQNFQNTLYMRSKVGDTDNALVVAAGTIRVFINGGSGLAATDTVF